MKLAAHLNKEFAHKVFGSHSCLCDSTAQLLDAGGQVLNDGQEQVVAVGIFLQMRQPQLHP